AFVDAAVAADEDVVFDDDGARVHRLEHATDLRSRADVHALTHLGARANEGMRIDHRLGADIRADVDEHRRHADHALREVRAATDAGSARDDANPFLRSKVSRGERVLVHEAEVRALGSLGHGHVGDAADTESEEYSLLYPRHC